MNLKIKIQLETYLFTRSNGELGELTRLRGQLKCCRPNEPEPGNTGGGKRKLNLSNQLSGTNLNNTKRLSQTKKVAVTAIMSSLIAVTTIIALPLPPPLSTINLAPIIIFTVSILFGPIIGGTSTAIGCAVGYLAGTSLGTILIPPGFLYIYLIGLIAARTPMAIVTGLFRKKSEILGMILGVITETLIFFAIDLVLFGIAIAIFDFGTLIDLVYVPITFAILISLRKILGTKYLS